MSAKIAISGDRDCYPVDLSIGMAKVEGDVVPLRADFKLNQPIPRMTRQMKRLAVDFERDISQEDLATLDAIFSKTFEAALKRELGDKVTLS